MCSECSLQGGGEKRTARKVLGNGQLEDLFSITFIERNSEGNMRGTYLELQMCYYIPLNWTNAPLFAATLINEHRYSWTQN